MSRTSSARHLAREVLSFNMQMERIGEVVVVIMLGALLTRSMFSGAVCCSRWRCSC